MAYDYSRGKFYHRTSDTILDTGKVLSEEDSFKSGLFTGALPFGAAGARVIEAVFGKVRVIIIRGVKFGTQLQIEAFIKQFDDKLNVVGLQDQLEYYPLVHPGNSAAGGSEGNQHAFYQVLINDFTTHLSNDDAGFILQYEMELFQGTVIL